MRRCGFSVALFFALAVLAGCAPLAPYRMPPDHEARLRAIRTVALLPPEVEVYSLTVFDRRHFVKEWSEAARKNLAEAIGKHAGKQGRFLLKEYNPGGPPPAEEAHLKVRPRLTALLSRISEDAWRATEEWGKVPSDSKAAPFVYSLGPLTSLTNAAEADAVLFVSAEDEISTEGRQAARVVGTILGALGAGVGSLGGAGFRGGGGGDPQGGVTMMRMALVDSRRGDILWLYKWGDAGGYDLRDPASADKVVTIAFDHFREATTSGKPKGD